VTFYLAGKKGGKVSFNFDSENVPYIVLIGKQMQRICTIFFQAFKFFKLLPFALGSLKIKDLTLLN